MWEKLQSNWFSIVFVALGFKQSYKGETVAEALKKMKRNHRKYLPFKFDFLNCFAMWPILFIQINQSNFQWENKNMFLTIN